MQCGEQRCAASERLARRSAGGSASHPCAHAAGILGRFPTSLVVFGAWLCKPAKRFAAAFSIGADGRHFGRTLLCQDDVEQATAAHLWRHDRPHEFS
mmetsp:Transcript_125474/g.360654  ORF Transcript_125474/g.360654 Transcript_125474/m.360654 type:complete len:97 (+) Transcript_125474:1306-1596(+)